MDNKLQVNGATPRIGLNLIADPIALKEGEYTHMLNGCLNDVTGKTTFARMYGGNKKATQFTEGYHSLCQLNINQKEVCLFLVHPSTGDSEIGLFDGKNYRTVVNDKKLGFKITKQIQAVYDEDFNGKKNVIWVDDENNIRIMDLNNPPMIDGALDVEALNIFKTYTHPNLQVTDIKNGGRLASGSYYVTLQYADENGNGLTSWTTPVGPIFIYRDSFTQPKDFINGSPDREPTDKSIEISLNNIDQSFKYLNVGIVKSFEGIRTAVVASTIPTLQEKYLYTGTRTTETDVDLKEIITPAVTYSSAKTVCLSNGVLLLGNLRGKAEYNLQPYISKIELLWQASRQLYNSENSYANPKRALYELQFRRNEVYDLAVVIRWKDGTKSRAFPLISRKKDLNRDGSTITLTQDVYGNTITGGWDSSTSVDAGDVYETGGNMPERHKVYNTAYIKGTDIGANTEGPAMYGEFGYIENSERYPLDVDVWGEDAGQPIRRFLFPDHSIVPVVDGEDAVKTDTSDNYIYKLGIRFTNIEDVMNSLPDEVKADMEGWELVRADRRNNKSVIGSGLIFNMALQNWGDPANNWWDPANILTTPTTDDVRMYPNFPLNDIRSNYLIKKRAIGDEQSFDDQQGNDRYRKDVFTFISPDTSFNKNLLFAGDLIVHHEMYGLAKSNVRYVKPYPLLKDKGDDEDESAYHNITLGYYNNWKRAKKGNVRRQVKDAIYIPFNAQVGGGSTGLPVHNLTRESTVMLQLAKDLDNPIIEDTSRVHLTDPDYNCIFGLGTRTRNVSAHYASLISRIENQYGSVYDPQYVYTNYDNTQVVNNKMIFGGDSFVSPFSIKRQLLLFQNGQSFMDWENGSTGIDLKTSETIAGTRYYYEALRRNANRDSKTECEPGARLGKLPLLYTGIPIVFCESDYNIDLRINGEEQSATFYPNLKDGAMKLDEWAGIKNVDKDNDYSMNDSYNEQNDIASYATVNPFLNAKNPERTHYNTRVIFSLPGTPENQFNNLTVFLPLNYYDFLRNDGSLVDIRDVGNYQTVFRFEHAFYVNRVYTSMATENSKIHLGSGRMFETAPQKLVSVDNGYAGTGQQWAFNSTPFGHFCVDAKRDSVLIYGESLNDITMNDADTWFVKNMGFNLLKDIPSFPYTDNPANPEGIGFHSVYDSKNKMYILTKIDYELVDKSTISHYSIVDNQLMLNGSPVSLKDTRYFKDCSWTFSYSPLTKKWIGWHSFVPTAYFQFNNNYYCIKGNEIYEHNSGTPRTYFGVRYPFEIQIPTVSHSSNLTHNVSIMTRAFPIVNDVMLGEDPDETFNKGFFHNHNQATGLVDLIVQDENDLSTLIRFENTSAEGMEKFIRKLNKAWNVDELYDMVKDPKLPFLKPQLFPEIDHTNIDYTRDFKESAYLRDLWLKCLFRYDRQKDVQIYVYLLQSMSEISMK